MYSEPFYFAWKPDIVHDVLVPTKNGPDLSIVLSLTHQKKSDFPLFFDAIQYFSVSRRLGVAK